MNNWFNEEENQRYVVLNKPKNKRYMVVLIAVVAFVVVLATSNMWLPDNRARLTTHTTGKEYSFSSSDLVVERVAYNPNNLIGEIRVREHISNAFTKKEITYEVTDDRGRELPVNVISSEYISSSADKKTGDTWVIIQFAIEPDYYGFTLSATEEGYTARNITFDYRDVPNMNLIEKGNDYLLHIPELFKNIDVTKTSIETLEKNLLDIQPEVNIAENELELATEDKKQTLQENYDKLVKEKEELQKQLDEEKLKLEDFEKQMEEWERE